MTLLAAIVAAAVAFPLTATRGDIDRTQITLSAALAVVGAGLLLGAWFGRDRKLVAAGAALSLALAGTSVAADPSAARGAHEITWRPPDAPSAERSHRIVVGAGTVDLTTVPLRPGARLRVRAEVVVGTLTVVVPAGARVEVRGRALLGDITVDRHVTSGPRARVDQVLQPESGSAGEPGTATAATAPVIELDLSSKVGDMVVSRVQA